MTAPQERKISGGVLGFFLLGMFVTAAIAAAFLLALQPDFHPEITGLLARWASFVWQFGCPAGIASVLIFVIAYRKHLFGRRPL